jgi:hypothetical protein
VEHLRPGGVSEADAPARRSGSGNEAFDGDIYDESPIAQGRGVQIDSMLKATGVLDEPLSDAAPAINPNLAVSFLDSARCHFLKVPLPADARDMQAERPFRVEAFNSRTDSIDFRCESLGQVCRRPGARAPGELERNPP